MVRASEQPKDPLSWCVVLALGFAALCAIRLGIPTKPYFDEVHYLPAARELLALGQYTNREHPLLGKELIALGIALFGDGPLGWRSLPLLAGTAALFASMRALWFATMSRFAALSYGLLLATAGFLLVHSRIAMLDIFYVTFLAIGYWQCAGAMREPETGRRRLAIAGIALGLAMASKWNAIPLAALPGLAFLVLRWSAGRRRLFLSRRGIPVPGVTLVEAAVWLGLVPLAVYAATYLPAWFFAEGAIGSPGGPANLIAQHVDMLSLQEGVLKHHPYQSRWPQWVFDIRPIWYLYEKVDGAQRGILMLGNPVSMLLGLPALLWCAYRGLFRREAAPFAMALLYAITLGFWILAAKPVQFYYHYLLPSMFLLGALALACDNLWRSGRRWLAVAPILASLAMFAYFYPVLSAARLDGPMAFLAWAWFPSWR